jgi:hypothetical protein
MILARQTCFCGPLLFATTASRRARSAAVTSTRIPLRMPQTRTTHASRESSTGLARQIGCTRIDRYGYVSDDKVWYSGF